MSVLVTQLAGEVLRTGPGLARITQLAVEVLHGPIPPPPPPPPLDAVLWIERGSLSSPPVYTSVGEIIGIDGWELTREVADATHLKTKWRDKVAAGLRSGTLSFVCNFYLDSFLGFHSDLGNDAPALYRVGYPAEPQETTPVIQWDFSGFLDSMHLVSRQQGQITASLTIRLTGSIRVQIAEGT